MKPLITTESTFGAHISSFQFSDGLEEETGFI